MESSSPQELEPQVLEVTDTRFITIIQDELEELSANFHRTLETIDKLIEIESLDMEKDEAELRKKAEEFDEVADHRKGSLGLLKIKKFENDFEQLYVDNLEELGNVTHDSFGAYRQNFEGLYEEEIKSNELRQLEKSSEKIMAIDVDDEDEFEADIDFSKPLDTSDDAEKRKGELKNSEATKEEADEEKTKAEPEDVEMDEESEEERIARLKEEQHKLELFKRHDYNELSEESIYRLLRIEKVKRARLSYTNENIAKPEISKLKREFEKWVNYDNQLKRFFTTDIPEMNKKVQTIKKKEKV